MRVSRAISHNYATKSPLITISGSASSENSPGPGKVLKMFARFEVLK